jgi:hypothetical protein
MIRPTTLLPTLAVLALPVHAQKADETRPIKIENADQDACFTAVLVSASDAVQPLGSDQVLADAQLRMLLPMPGGKYALDLALPRWFSGDIYWQAVAVDAQGLRVRPVQKLHVIQDPGDQAADVDATGEPKAICGGAVILAPGLTLELQDQDNDGVADTLEASFEAPAEGHRLALVRAVTSGEATPEMHVYLYRMSPELGDSIAGEDVRHAVTAALADNARVLRVFLAEGARPEPGPWAAYAQIAKFELP